MTAKRAGPLYRMTAKHDAIVALFAKSDITELALASKGDIAEFADWVVARWAWAALQADSGLVGMKATIRAVDTVAAAAGRITVQQSGKIAENTIAEGMLAAAMDDYARGVLLRPECLPPGFEGYRGSDLGSDATQMVRTFFSLATAMAEIAPKVVRDIKRRSCRDDASARREFMRDAAQEIDRIFGVWLVVHVGSRPSRRTRDEVLKAARPYRFYSELLKIAGIWRPRAGEKFTPDLLANDHRHMRRKSRA
jgi:hypothetical protein